MALEETTGKAGKRENQLIKISLTVLLSVLLFLIEIYEIMNDPNNFAVIGVLGVFMTAALLSGTIFINSFIKSRIAEQDEAYHDIFRSEKASYLLMRKYFDQIDRKIDDFGRQIEVPYKELFAAQKALAKMQINKNRENADAILISNDKMIHRINNFQKEIMNANTSSAKEKITEENDYRQQLMEKQQEFLNIVKEMETSLRNEISEAVNTLNSNIDSKMELGKELELDSLEMPKETYAPQMEMQDNAQLFPLDIEEDFSETETVQLQPAVHSSTESDLDNLLLEMDKEKASGSAEKQQEINLPELGAEPAVEIPELEPIEPELNLNSAAQEPELGLIMEEPELKQIRKEPELGPIVEEPKLGPIVEEPKLGPIVEEPELEQISKEPELGPIVEEPELGPIMGEPELEPIVEGAAPDSIMKESSLEPIMEEPSLEPINVGTDMLSSQMESAKPEPELKQLMSEPESEIKLPELNMGTTGLEQVKKKVSQSELAAQTASHPSDIEKSEKNMVPVSEPEQQLKQNPVKEKETASMLSSSVPKAEKPRQAPEKAEAEKPNQALEKAEAEKPNQAPELSKSEKPDPISDKTEAEVPKKEIHSIEDLNTEDKDLEQIMKEMNIDDILDQPLEDIDIDKILDQPPAELKKPSSDPSQVMSSDEIAALIKNTDLLFQSDSEDDNAAMPDLTDPGYIMNSDEIAALIANM